MGATGTRNPSRLHSDMASEQLKVVSRDAESTREDVWHDRAMIRTYLLVNGAPGTGHGHLIKTGLLIGLSTGSVRSTGHRSQLDLVPACF